MRHYIFHLIEDIEVAVKTQLAYILSKYEGPYGYLDFSQWCNKEEFCKHYIKYKEQKFKTELKQALKNKPKEEIGLKVKQSRNKFPPIWLAVDLLTFGQMVNVLDLMAHRKMREISKTFNCTNAELISWLKCLNLIRNFCAHNDNIIDVKLKTPPIIRNNWKQNLYQYKLNVYTNRIAIVILILEHFMSQINPGHWKLKDVFKSFKKIVKDNTSAHYYGFIDKNYIFSKKTSY